MSELILKNKLFDKVLLEPSGHYDELCIVSGFATPGMVEHHLEKAEKKFGRKDIQINLIIGMTPSAGISEAHHKNFIKLVKARNDAFSCSYIQAEACPVHSKLYLWKKNNIPQKSFISSANYTVNAFIRQQDEIANECNPAEAYEYYKSKIALSAYCTAQESEDFVRKEQSLFDNGSPSEKSRKLIQGVRKENEDWVSLSLVSNRDGEVPLHSGLNWGHREHYKRDLNQAYIPIPAHIQRLGFFPPKGQQFSVITSEGFPLICVVAQDGADKSNPALGKAIHTTNDNSELGRYFRDRLNVPSGQLINREDLDRFGSRNVKFFKISDEEYIMDFNPE